MNWIVRTIEKTLFESLKPQKVTILVGPRRTGKTFLLRKIMALVNEPYLALNGEDIQTHLLLAKRSVADYLQMLGAKRLLFIDEAQKVPEIGSYLKLMVDEIPGLRVFITGSSALELANSTGEPLTGRQTVFRLFPFSAVELAPFDTPTNQSANLKSRLVFGGYPEILSLEEASEKADYLQQLVNSYLLKDILQYEDIRNSSRIFNLLRLVAFQTGQQVSTQELGRQLSMNRSTVEKYLDLLVKMFILVKLDGFSRNLRKEVSKSSKYYFIDTGIRNAIVSNFNPIDQRQDAGQLWENYLIAERIKYQHYNKMIVNNFFWRTYDQQELDWVEERGGELWGYEFKWGKLKAIPPVAWQKTYPEANFMTVHPENYRSFLGLNNS